MRTTIARALESTVGSRRTDWIRSRERGIRRRAARWLEPGSPTASGRRGAARPAASSAPRTPEELASRPASGWQPADPPAVFPAPERGHYDFLALLHELLVPRTYLEIGVRSGDSLALSAARSIGVDPAYSITAELHCDVRLVRETSDDFFSRPDAVEHFGGTPVDLALIDGMHLSEFALRDFMNVEKLMAPTGVIVFDDILPRNALEAARDRRTKGWTGDVYKVLAILEEQRPDLTVVQVNTSATGTAVVLGADPTSRVLEDNYESNLARCRSGDPQVVPPELLSRAHAVQVSQLTGSEAWSRLVALRESGDASAVAAVLADLSALAGGRAART